MSKYLRPIRKGEYDLINISLIGYDPNTLKSYDECHAAWKEQTEVVKKAAANVRWWDIPEYILVTRQAYALRSHFGL